jgi:glycosyltransferase involved in cell wall biosynthesis
MSIIYEGYSTSMKKHVVIVINYESPDSVTNPIPHTVDGLMKLGHVVVVFDMIQVPFLSYLPILIDSIKAFFGKLRKSQYWYHPLFIPFLSRNKYIYNICIISNFLFICLWIKLRFRSNSKIIWFIYPHIAFLVPFVPASYHLVYDVVDYFTSSDTQISLWLEKQKTILKNRANGIFCISKALMDSCAIGYERKSYVVPPGFYTPKHDTMLNTLNKHTHHPIIGYVGRISERLDMLLLNKLTESKDWDFVFVGPREDNNLLNQMFQKSNVYHIPLQSRENIYSLLNTFDVCIIPYDVRQLFNRYCYPMKLMEYFYMGKPIVSTPMEAMLQFPDYVRVGKTVEEWDVLIRTIINNPWSLKKRYKQREIAINNSWSNKIKETMCIVDLSILKGRAEYQ